MEVVGKNRGRKSLIFKTWQLCRSMGGDRDRNKSFLAPILRSRSWPRSGSASPMSSPDESKRRITKRQVAPQGCFTVYVGPQRQRFVIKTEYVNHPLFKMLLEEAELEYGYNSQGPLALPCDVDLFDKVLSEMDCDKVRQGCCFAKSVTAYYLLKF